MKTKRIVAIVAIIITLIISSATISSIVEAKNVQDLIDEIIEISESPIWSEEEAEDVYYRISDGDIYIDIMHQASLGNIDRETLTMFKDILEDIMANLGNFGDAADIRKEVSSWITSINDSISGQNPDENPDTSQEEEEERKNLQDIMAQLGFEAKYKILEEASKNLGSKTTETIEKFVDAAQQVVDKYEKYTDSGFTSDRDPIYKYEEQVTQIKEWIKEAKWILDARMNGEVTQGPYTPTYFLKIGDTFTFEGFNNDKSSVEGSGYVVPTTMLINGRPYSVYCVDHGDSPGSRLRTSNIREHEPGDTLTTHSSSNCDEDSDEEPSTEQDYFDPPVFTIGYAYDITGRDNQFQKVGYILANDGKEPGEPASWIAQQAIWLTDINRGHVGITDPSDQFESDPSAVTKSKIINRLSFEVLTEVEQASIDIQNSKDKGEILRNLEKLIQYLRDEQQVAETEDLKNFYDKLLNSPECGIVGVYTWVDKSSDGEIFSNVKANVYQFLMTIDSEQYSNLRDEIVKEVERLSEELAALDQEDAMSISKSGALLSEANAYQDFYNKLQETNGELKVTDDTEQTTVNIDRNTKTYNVGPFKVGYYDKAVKHSAVTGQRVDFAKITAIKIYDQNNNLYKTLSEDKFDEEGNLIEEGKREFKITKTQMQADIDEDYIFPKNDEPFWVVFTGDRGTSGTTVDPSTISLEIEFDYIACYRAEMYRTKLGATQKRYRWEKTSGTHKVYCSNSNCDGHTCTKNTYKLTEKDSARIQEQLVVSAAEPIIKQTSIRLYPKLMVDGREPGTPPPPTTQKEHIHEDEITMKISGKVFWDENGGKESLPNGIFDKEDGEKLLKNIEVSLYEYNTETGESVLATLAPAKADENGKVEIRTNPTVTDDEGYYVFEGVRAMNQYYVEFSYNGQIYQATTFTAQSEEQDEATLEKISNAMETQKEEERKVKTGTTRITYNARFEKIGSSPHNYQSTNSLGYGVSGKTYTQKELMGYKLVAEGNGAYDYKKDGSVVQLLDEIVDGKQVEGIISQKINKYIYGTKQDGTTGTLYDPGDNAHGVYPNLKDDIYSEIINEYSGSDPEIQDKLQYIEDIKMTSDTNHTKVNDIDIMQNNLIAKYEKFTLDKNDCVFEKGVYYLVDTSDVGNKNKIDFVEAMDVKQEGNTTITYHSLYAEQKNVNLGVNERPETDISLRQDVEKVTLEINGKTHTYDYDTRQGMDEQGNLDNSGTWDIGVRLSEAYFDTNYSRELYKSDYLYKASNYGNQAQQNVYGKSKSDELQVYVTYKITVRNQSMSIKTRIDEVVQYYDEDYEYISDRSYAVIGRGGSKTEYPNLKTTYNEESKTSSSIYGGDTQITPSGYQTLYIQALDGRYLNSGETGYIYVTFRVKKDNRDNEDWLRLDEQEDGSAPIGVGKENVAEINGYSTIYVDDKQVPNVGDVGGTPAGIVDRDSTPGNLEEETIPKDGEIKYLEFEDDTDKAPNIRLVLYRDSDREIQGTVWEDNRSEEEQSAFIADGIRQDNETPINGVTVQLVELMPNGTEFVWREFEKGSGTSRTTSAILNKLVGNDQHPLVNAYDLGENYAGKYAFKSFVPGSYMVRFIYGDTVRTVLVNSNASGDTNTQKSAEIAKLVKDLFGEDGLNAKSYNGQDYKSTTYQEGIAQTGAYTMAEGKTISAYTDIENQNTSGTYYYNIAESDKLSNVSDAKDIMTDTNGNPASSRPDATLNSRQDVIDYSKENLKNHIAEVLASYVERPTYKNIDNNEAQEAYTAEEVKQLIEELINKTKMTAETGIMNVEFEYNTQATPNETVNNKHIYQINNLDLGLEERPKSQIELEKEIANVKITLSDSSVLFDTNEQATNVLWQQHKFYDLGYNGKILDNNKFGSIENIRNRNSGKFGVVQPSMDEELMHGATIQITYNITAINVGEVDYNDNSFYYTGRVANTGSVVPTIVNQVVDYIANNLQFYENDNSGWKIISKEDLLNDEAGKQNSSLVNKKLEKQINQYNTIITTENLSTTLVPTIYKQDMGMGEDRVSTPLVLTQLISPENEKDDLSYRNIIEVVRTSNTVGRKNQYSVAGNQDPTESPKELDSDMSETVKILPPFGAIATNYILWISVGLILIAGIGFIIFKVIKNKQ